MPLDLDGLDIFALQDDVVRATLERIRQGAPVVESLVTAVNLLTRVRALTMQELIRRGGGDPMTAAGTDNPLDDSRGEWRCWCPPEWGTSVNQSFMSKCARCGALRPEKKDS